MQEIKKAIQDLVHYSKVLEAMMFLKSEGLDISSVDISFRKKYNIQE